VRYGWRPEKKDFLYVLGHSSTRWCSFKWDLRSFRVEVTTEEKGGSSRWPRMCWTSRASDIMCSRSRECQVLCQSVRVMVPGIGGRIQLGAKGELHRGVR
jgi:hypothetical protein